MGLGASCKRLEFVKGDFKIRICQESLTSFIEVGHFGYLDANIIMWGRVGEYGLEDIIWVLVQHEESNNFLIWTMYSKKSNLSTFIL